MKDDPVANKRLSDSVAAHHKALLGKVDDFFQRVAGRHGDDMQCASGCANCCKAELTITQVEADALLDWLAAQPRALRMALAKDAAAVADPHSPRCVALDQSDRCRVYDARPMVCRSHGVPMKMGHRNGLPVIDACHLNFTARGPAAADADCVLDQETLSVVLLAIDGAHARIQSATPGRRVSIRDLFAAL